MNHTNNNQTCRLMRRNEVERSVGLKTSRLYELIKQGVFPAPIAITENRRMWLADEVNAWIDERIAESRGGVK